MPASTEASCRTSGAAHRRQFFFNLNSHTYKGRKHWTRLWQFYQPNVRSGYWTPFDLGGVVSNDLAVVWCERHTQSEWIGRDPPPQGRRYGVSFISRSTMVFRRKRATGASSTCISRKRARRRVRAASERESGAGMPPDLPRFSLRLHQGLTPQACRALAASAEAHGFHTLWFAENPFGRAILPAVAAARPTRPGSGLASGS